MDASGSGYGAVADSCEHSNVTSGSIRSGKSLDYRVTVSLWRGTLLCCFFVCLFVCIYLEINGKHWDEIYRSQNVV